MKDLYYGNATRLYDALYASLDRLQGVDGRKMLLLFTDVRTSAADNGQDARWNGHVTET